MDAPRTGLIRTLEQHHPEDAQERADLERLRRAARELADPFSREQSGAHFTASALIVDPEGRRVCLIHHAKLSRWLQPGGHCEPADEGSMEQAALREVKEETGLDVSLHEHAPRPLDVDAHRIPARKAEPAHDHLDVRYLVVARDPEALRHDPAESHGARWMGWEEAMTAADEPGLRRLLAKGLRCVQRG